MVEIATIEQINATRIANENHFSAFFFDLEKYKAVPINPNIIIPQKIMQNLLFNPKSNSVFDTESRVSE